MRTDEVKKGQRIRLIKTESAFGSESQAKAVLDALGLEGARERDIEFWKGLEQSGIKQESEGTVVNLYTDGWVDVQFDGFDKAFDIPAHCLEEIEEEENDSA